jgi:uncharacterized Zn-binding protein involved in type VI secretion
MTKLPVARIGDSSDHGGTIISSCQKTKAEGKLIARVTDLHSCPIPFHGVTPIVTGSPNYFVEGKKCARSTSTTGCGASIIGGSKKTFCD